MYIISKNIPRFCSEKQNEILKERSKYRKTGTIFSMVSWD